MPERNSLGLSEGFTFPLRILFEFGCLWAKIMVPLLKLAWKCCIIIISYLVLANFRQKTVLVLSYRAYTWAKHISLQRCGALYRTTYTCV